jgi:hypothetical protein
MREIVYTDSQDMLVLTSIVAWRYYNCCTDSSTNPGNYGYTRIAFCSLSLLSSLSALVYVLTSSASHYPHTWGLAWLSVFITAVISLRLIYYSYTRIMAQYI